MKSNDSKRLIIAAVVGVVFVCLILALDYLTKGKNLMLSHLVQGEVLAGIVIALPTLWTWNNAINESRENKKTIVSDNIRDTVKYYDKQLFDLISDISESRQLPFHKAEKIEYIIETYNSLLKDWNEKNNSNISLDFVQVLSAICSIEYPKDIENPNDDSVENWKYNLGTALRPTMKEVILLEKEEVLSSKEIKYFSYISFGSVGYELKKIDFKDKHFVQCTFSSNFIDLNSFKGCTFINCSISSGILSDESKQKLLDNEIRGSLKDENDEDILNKEKEGTSEVFTVDSNKQELTHGRVFDARENIVVDDYVLGNNFFNINSDSVSRREIYMDIVNDLNSKYNLGIGNEINNKKISISKNYITEDNKFDFISESLFSGWHSLFESKIQTANNFKYYIFCIRDENDYYAIVFETEKFIEFLKRKNIDKTGKYNFYFNGFKK